MAAVSLVVVAGGTPVRAAEVGDTTAPVVQDVGIAAGARVNKVVVLEPVVSDDAAGNRATAAVTVYADTYGPFLYFPWVWSDSEPQMPNMSFTGVVPIDLRIQGVPADTARIELSAGDTVIGVADAEPWTIPWDTSGYDGKITLTARSWDASGNEGVAVSRVWADHTGPSIKVEFDFADGYVRARSGVDVIMQDPAWAQKVELLINDRVVSSRINDGARPRLDWDRAAVNGPATMTVRSIFAASVTGTKDATGLAYFASTLPRVGYAFTLDPKKYGKTFTVQLRAYDQAGNAAYSSKRTYRR